MEKKPKKIDAVRMVRCIRDAHYKELEGATREERIAFFNSRVRQSKEADSGKGRARKSAV